MKYRYAIIIPLNTNLWVVTSRFRTKEEALRSLSKISRAEIEKSGARIVPIDDPRVREYFRKIRMKKV